MGAVIQYEPTQDEIDEFYRSRVWLRLSYATKKRYNFKCQCCGRSAVDGVILNTDHIKPIRLHWALRLDPDNLQVLCEQDNIGKGSWDETDHRRKRAESYLGNLAKKLTVKDDYETRLKQTIIDLHSDGRLSDAEVEEAFDFYGLAEA